MRGSAIRSSYTSKQEKKVGGKGRDMKQSLILSHSRVGYYYPAVIVRDAFVGVVETEN